MLYWVVDVGAAMLRAHCPSICWPMTPKVGITLPKVNTLA